MVYLVLGERNDSVLPTDREEQMKIMMPIMENVKKDIDSGELLMWGVSPGGSRGFVVSKQDEKTIHANLSMVAPYWKFEVTPMLSIDEVIEAAKAMQK